MFFWMINIGSYKKLLFNAFCIDFKLGKCLFHWKFNAKIIITLLPVAFHFQFCLCRFKSSFDRRRKIFSRCRRRVFIWYHWNTKSYISMIRARWITTWEIQKLRNNLNYKFRITDEVKYKVFQNYGWNGIAANFRITGFWNKMRHTTYICRKLSFLCKYFLT